LLHARSAELRGIDDTGDFCFGDGREEAEGSYGRFGVGDSEELADVRGGGVYEAVEGAACGLDCEAIFGRGGGFGGGGGEGEREERYTNERGGEAHVGKVDGFGGWVTWACW